MIEYTYIILWIITFLNLGFLSIRWYGFLISISVLIGLFISKKLAKERNIDPLYISEFLPLLITSSIIGARAYYVIFEWRQYSGNNFFRNVHTVNCDRCSGKGKLPLNLCSTCMGKGTTPEPEITTEPEVVE